MIVNKKVITLVLDLINHFSDNINMDWKKIIKELMNTGLTQSQIASRCNTGQSNISGLLTGKRKSPGWSLGESLLKLHKEETSGSKEAA